MNFGAVKSTKILPYGLYISCLIHKLSPYLELTMMASYIFLLAFSFFLLHQTFVFFLYK